MKTTRLFDAQLNNKKYPSGNFINRNLFILLLTLIFGAANAQSPECSGFRTQTIGAWGADCSGNNSACYLASNFQSAFPNGLAIGCTNKLKLTSAQAINDFLPAGGAAAVLPAGILQDPGASVNNVLAAQLVGVTLAVGFDNYDPNFSENAMRIGDLKINFGPFQGLSVDQFLVIGNSVVGGCNGEYTLAEVNQAATLINQNFDNANSDNGFLSCVPPPLAMQDIIVTKIKCTGQSNGEIKVIATQGVPPYMYSWSNGATTASISGLAPGSYSVTVTDQTGNQFVASEDILQPEVLAQTITKTDVTCFGSADGRVKVTGTGGTAPYSYQWSNGSLSDQITALAPGSYVVTVTDANGCKSSTSSAVTQPTQLSLSLNAPQVSGSNGTAVVQATANGGTQPYQYFWNGSQNAGPSSASLGAGTQSVTVADTKGCRQSATTQVTVQSCSGFVTVSQNSWGTRCSNWANMLDCKFSSYFPCGLTIGNSCRSIKLTSATAVRAFLPSTGTASSLPQGNQTNPGSCVIKNSLAGQLVALMITVKFDACYSSFAPSSYKLSTLTIASGPLTGMTVSQLIIEANKALGGCGNYSASTLATAVEKVNLCYENGTVNTGYLNCPCSSNLTVAGDDELAETNELSTAPEGSESEEMTASVSEFNGFSFDFYPNPVKESATLKITSDVEGNVGYKVFNAVGQQVYVVEQTIIPGESSINFQKGDLSNGTYMVQLELNNELIKVFQITVQ